MKLIKNDSETDKILCFEIWLLFENRPALYFCNYKENKKYIYTYVGYIIYWLFYRQYGAIFSLFES